MTGGIRIGRILGFEVAIHPSWFIILVLFAFTLATGFFPGSYPGWGPVTTWAVAVTATLLLFVSVLAHELGHSLVARRQGIPVRNITLFLLGGVASIERDASSPSREAALAGVGPVVSVVIGAVSLALSLALPGPEQLLAILFYLGIANISLAVFNLLPGFPLDGGRVLRAILWWRTRDFGKATRGAAAVGQGFGYLFIGLGALLVISGSLFSGMWLGFIGWMLSQASQASAAQVALEERLAGLTAARIMTRPADWLAPYVTLSAAADGRFTDYETRCLPVEPEDEEQAFDGLVCAGDLRKTPPDRWDRERVRDVMMPAEETPIVTPDTPASEAIKLMATRGVDRVAVLDGGRLVGFVDQAAAVRYARYRSGSGGTEDAGPGDGGSEAGGADGRLLDPRGPTAV